MDDKKNDSLGFLEICIITFFRIIRAKVYYVMTCKYFQVFLFFTWFFPIQCEIAHTVKSLNKPSVI